MSRKEYIKAARIIAALYRDADNIPNKAASKLQKDKADLVKASFILFFDDGSSFDGLRFIEAIEAWRAQNAIR